MNTGMLWFDNDGKVDLPTKIERASAYYQKKYGKAPELCFVHPSMLPENAPGSAKIEVKTTRHVMPNHLWLGTHDGPAMN